MSITYWFKQLRQRRIRDLITLFRTKRNCISILQEILPTTEKTSQELQITPNHAFQWPWLEIMMLGLSRRNHETLNFKRFYSQSYASCLSGWSWLQFCSYYLSPKHLSNQKSILVWQTPLEWDLIQPLPNVCCKSWNRAHAVDPDHRHALCLIVVYALILNL